MALLSFRAYAKHRGVSHEAVRKAVHAGRISTVQVEGGRKLIDPSKADQEWAENSSFDHKRQPYRAEKTAAQAGEPPPASPGAPSYLQSRAIREAYAARLAKLEFEEKSAKLISVDRVKVEAFKIARTVRDAVLNIPDRIANELASYGGDPVKIHERMTQELILALEELVNAGKRQL